MEAAWSRLLTFMESGVAMATFTPASISRAAVAWSSRPEHPSIPVELAAGVGAEKPGGSHRS